MECCRAVVVQAEGFVLFDSLDVKICVMGGSTGPKRLQRR